MGVIAVDPSSPFTMGAILGDRIRYSEHFSDRGVFIRSVGSRGALGGITGSVYLFLRAFDIWQFDIVLVETVGVGQTELEVMNVADKVCVVVVPEFGDAIQTLKAGILEIADVFVVNKADRPGADVLARELESWAAEEGVPVLKTVATNHDGVESLGVFLKKKTDPAERSALLKLRYRAEARAILRLKFEEKMMKKTSNLSSSKDLLKAIKLKF